jgi:RNA polymerase sigma factor (sigma-70 family)
LAGSFRKLDDRAVDDLNDEDLVAHLVASREAGLHEQATLALQIFVYRHEGTIITRVRGKVPDHEVESVVNATFQSAIDSVFSEEKEPWSGETYASCRAWLRTITRRRIADYYRRGEQPRLVPLPEEHAEAEDVFGPDVAVEEDETGRIEVEEIIDTCLEELSPSHRMVVELAVFADLPSREVAERLNDADPDLNPAMSAANVDQIKSRFRSAVRKMLEEDD